MAARPRPPPAKSASPYRLVFLIGLIAVALGMGLLMLSFDERDLRLPGAASLLLGVVVTGGYLTIKLFSGMYSDPLAYEPPWAKLGRGEGPPRLPAPGKQAAPPSAPVAIDKLIDFPEPAPTRRPPMPVSKPAPNPPAPPAWTPELFDRMTPNQFDAICQTLFAQSGLQTRVRPHGPAGGVTIWMFSRNAQQDMNKPVAVAVCRLWPGQPLSIQHIQALPAVMAERQLKRATYATASTFTDGARKFAKDNGINTMDRFGLLALIATRTPAQQQALMAIALNRR